MSDDLSGDDLLAINPDKPVALPGSKCAYFGLDLERSTATSDHVVARNFVPEGTLAGGFHLRSGHVVRATTKARLENDISIITMLPDTAGHCVSKDERLLRTVACKAKVATSAAMRKLAVQSYNRVHACYPIAGGSLTYDGVAMPS
ncbi:MAG: hypothetical protein JWM91_5009 [Rhodospirillales bacterium]|nr:hypothetical protein [Rhodospirillales bacterium]